MNARAQEVIEQQPQSAAVIPLQNSPMQMLSAAIERGMDPGTLKELMDLEQRWSAAQAKKAYDEAFASFKSMAVSVIRNKTVQDGPLKGKSYAELYAVVDAVTPALSIHGLSASWRVTKDERDWIEVTCYLRHVQGHTESSSFSGPPDSGGAKNPIQARASTKSYLERYTLLAVTGLAAKDQDKDGGKGKAEVEADPEGKALLEKAASLAGLQSAWKALTAEQRKTLGAVKDECKARIEAADKAAQ